MLYQLVSQDPMRLAPIRDHRGRDFLSHLQRLHVELVFDVDVICYGTDSRLHGYETGPLRQISCCV
ncbi:hypothetical protein DPMN_128328 [Dreissena polymorpha]|uniref:Uncharacterized protein n=1 Tax=Dreissena polymorpha TaxID=45954 RepID=A0A9D4H2W4_DREPO|nr:hypothetical protein DPMN_128328 [Dreissena polymorpha]